MSTVPALHSAVVTTTDNASPVTDNQTSLLEALANVKDNETITFNIPGAGPHYILTPAAGYPLVEKRGVTINGYSQPGASPNTAAPDQPRNTKIQIILDSRTEVPGERRTVLNYDGFGLSESGVLSFVNAPNTSVRGLSFIGVSGAGNNEDPAVYCIALAISSPDAKIQGCWFGLDAGKTSWTPNAEGVVPGVHGAATAVASFAAKTGDAAGLIFGTDGDGTGDSGEGNVCMAQRLAVALTAPRVTVAGNWINFYPDGSLLNLESLQGATTSAVENGNGIGMRIGTNGDAISDAEEANRFGPVTYKRFVEFYKPDAQGIVFAGNYIGMGLDGMPAFESSGSSLLNLQANSSIRIGTDGNGTGDVAESNHISGLKDPFIELNSPVRVGIRGNEISGSLGTIPYTAGLPPAASLETLFADILNDATMTAVTLDPASTPASVSGTFPEQLSGTNPPVIDFYLADAFGLRQDPPNPQGRYWLGSFAADGAADLDPAAGKFKFNTTTWALTAAELGQLTATATYTVDVPVEDGTLKAGVTTNFSETLALPTPGAALSSLTIAPAAGGGYALSWTGGISPFRVLSSTSLNGVWSPVSTVSAQTTTVTPNTTTTPRQFYRIREGASPR
ncbi:MAG: hypothetical protein V4726_03860 [Verrucomicrobiota bacterium]